MPEYRIQAGDLIELYINDEFFPPEGAKTVQKDRAEKNAESAQGQCHL